MQTGADPPWPAVTNSLVCVSVLARHLLPGEALPVFDPRYPGIAGATWRLTGVTCRSESGLSETREWWQRPASTDESCMDTGPVDPQSSLAQTDTVIDLESVSLGASCCFSSIFLEEAMGLEAISGLLLCCTWQGKHCPKRVY